MNDGAAGEVDVVLGVAGPVRTDVQIHGVCIIYSNNKPSHTHLDDHSQISLFLQCSNKPERWVSNKGDDIAFIDWLGLIYKYNQTKKLSTKLMHFHIPKTPLKTYPNNPRTRSNVSTLSYSNPHSLKPPPHIANRTIHTHPPRLHTQQRLNTEEPAENYSAQDDSASSKMIGFSPSLKTQKKQYLKLFTTATTNKQQQTPENASNQSVVASSFSVRLKKASSQNGSKNSNKQDKNQSQEIIISPKRKLFTQILIENEQKIELDSLDNNSFPNDSNHLAPYSITSNSKSNDILNPNNQTTSPNQLICQGCLKFLPNDKITLHQQSWQFFEELSSLSPKNRMQMLRRKGLQLIHKIQQQSGGIPNLAEHCSAFLKECELAWSAGRPSEIYNFKLKELNCSSNKLAACLSDIHRLNSLLTLLQHCQQT